MPLVIVPTFILDPNWDYFLFSKVQVAEVDPEIVAYKPELPTE